MDTKAAERWARREAIREELRWSGISPYKRFDPDQYLRTDDRPWWALSAQEKSAARIEHVKKLLARNLNSHILRKRLRRMEKTHAQRNLLGWKWLEDHPEHPLSPVHQDWLKYGPKQPL